MRGASLDNTARKLAEEAAHDLSGRLIHAREKEQTRLARELHDDLSQSLALLSVELEMFGQSPPAERGPDQRTDAGILGAGEEIVVRSSPAFARTASGETGATRPCGGGARILQGIRGGARDGYRACRSRRAASDAGGTRRFVSTVSRRRRCTTWSSIAERRRQESNWRWRGASFASPSLMTVSASTRRRCMSMAR